MLVDQLVEINKAVLHHIIKRTWIRLIKVTGHCKLAYQKHQRLQANELTVSFEKPGTSLIPKKKILLKTRN